MCKIFTANAWVCNNKLFGFPQTCPEPKSFSLLDRFLLCRINICMHCMTFSLFSFSRIVFPFVFLLQQHSVGEEALFRFEIRTWISVGIFGFSWERQRLPVEAKQSKRIFFHSYMVTGGGWGWLYTFKFTANQIFQQTSQDKWQNP